MLVTNGGDDGGGVDPVRKVATHDPPRGWGKTGDLDGHLRYICLARALRNRILVHQRRTMVVGGQNNNESYCQTNGSLKESHF